MSGNRMVWEQAKAYWFGHVQIGLTKDHDYVGQDMFCMEDAIAALDPGEESDEDEGEEDEECEEAKEAFRAAETGRALDEENDRP
jgi:hypothetical protein